MKFEEAIVKSIKAFMEGDLPLNTVKASERGEIFYTPDYFDAYEEALEEGDFEEDEELEEDD